MRSLNYKIEIDKDGQPFVVLPNNYKDNKYDKFMILSLATNMFTNILNKNIEDGFPEELSFSDEEEREKSVYFLENLIAAMSEIVFNFSEIIKKEIQETNKSSKTKKPTKKKYHIIVDNLKERNELPDYNIIYGDKIYERKEKSFRVFVKSTKKIYYLDGGITNKHWKIWEKY